MLDTQGMVLLHFGGLMSIIEGQREAGHTGTHEMIHLHFGGFMSIVEGQREAGDTGMIHFYCCGFMSIVEGQRQPGDTGADTSSFWWAYVNCRGFERSWVHRG